MKKITVLCLCFWLAPCVFAQNFRVWDAFHRARSERLEHAATRAANGQRQKLPWVQAVQRQIHRAQPQGMVGLKLDYVPAQIDRTRTVSKQMQPRVQQRARQLQEALEKHPVLRRFWFKVLDPQILYNLQDSDLAYVTRFLETHYTPAAVAPFDVQEYQHYMVRASLLTGGAAEVHLFFNCYAKEVYLSYGCAVLPGITLEPVPPQAHP